ncbi:MAG: adenosylmethionine--8-amino-7-oxononanoate transaminase [Gammaproteobacteria bacterium]|jgi:adenosylmethionine---8-amino-7-oxononanoate aminotransferase|nr:adenosylmethionine--8-amino-7-oxononanoate transaminase [Gammaproteobacteria bacterium]
MTNNNLTQRDRASVWHPYSSTINAPDVFPVESASGVYLKLSDGSQIIDGMASWWCAIHGYNHPLLNAAIESQLTDMAHVMFGGLTHAPAIDLAEKLVEITPASLQKVFFSDSGSVAVEVALKMAIQYWAAKGQPGKQKMLSLRQAYHGDTLGAMAVCDPVTGMHTLFNQVLSSNYFADAPGTRFAGEWREQDISSLQLLLEQHHTEIAALILEPVVQGAGGMWFYSAEYLRRARTLCDEYDVLLIADEIATGFGRSGKLFACEYADISPDIMCVGKALTGGYMTLAATLATNDVSETISDEGEGVFMHGPTFMANPLACSVALASINLLLAYDWKKKVTLIEAELENGLAKCRELSNVVDVRVLGAIGVVELDTPVDMYTIPAEFVKRGVWVRPFGKLVYVMPPYIIEAAELNTLCDAMYTVVKGLT